VVRLTPYRSLLTFWSPLALMWLIMGIEQPTIGAVVSRLPDATRSLAAFEVAFGVATLIHSPIVQMLSAATALAVDRASFRRLLRLLAVLVGGLSLLHLVIALPPVFAWIAGDLLGVPADLLPRSRATFIVLLPITAAVGLRRMLQGALIRAGLTRIVSLIMLSRLAITTLFLGAVLALDRWTAIPLPDGNVVASIAFVLGVASGAVHASIEAARHLPAAFAAIDEGAASHSTIATRRMVAIYVPLALTSVIIMLGRPLVAFAIARSREPVLSLAAWPIIQGYLFIFTALAHSYQEVVVARASTHPAETHFAARLGLAIGATLAAIMTVIIATPVSSLWFRVVIGVPAEILPLVLDAVAIVALVPLPVALLAVSSGVLVARHATLWITIGTVVSITAQITLGLVLPAARVLHGAQIAAIILASSAMLQFGVQRIGTGRLLASASNRSMPTRGSFHEH
jgi:hypothetical protein